MGFFNSVAEFFGEGTPKEDPQVKARREAGRHTVLVIDDDKDFLESCALMLREAGYNVLKCSNGPKGLNMLRYAPKDISVVLLDYDMPQFDGVDTLRFLRKISPQVRVGAISGVDEGMLPSDFLSQVDQFLAKPFVGEQLLAFVQAMANTPPSERAGGAVALNAQPVDAPAPPVAV